MSKLKEIEYKIKLAQLEKLNSILVKKEEVAKQFATFYNLLWTSIDELIINIANSLSQQYNLPFEKIVDEIRRKFYDLKKMIEENRIDD